MTSEIIRNRLTPSFPGTPSSLVTLTPRQSELLSLALRHFNAIKQSDHPYTTAAGINADFRFQKYLPPPTDEWSYKDRSIPSQTQWESDRWRKREETLKAVHKKRLDLISEAIQAWALQMEAAKKIKTDKERDIMEDAEEKRGKRAEKLMKKIVRVADKKWNRVPHVYEFKQVDRARLDSGEKPNRRVPWVPRSSLFTIDMIDKLLDSAELPSPSVPLISPAVEKQSENPLHSTRKSRLATAFSESKTIPERRAVAENERRRSTVAGLSSGPMVQGTVAGGLVFDDEADLIERKWDEDVESAVLAVQRIISGRYFQVGMDQAMELRKDLIDHLILENHAVVTQGTEESNLTTADSLVSETAHRLSVALDTLAAEHRRLVAEKTAEEAIQQALEVRRWREAAESGRRQARQIERARFELVAAVQRGATRECAERFVGDILEGLAGDDRGQEGPEDPTIETVTDFLSNHILPSANRARIQESIQMELSASESATEAVLLEAIARVHALHNP